MSSVRKTTGMVVVLSKVKEQYVLLLSTRLNTIKVCFLLHARLVPLGVSRKKNHCWSTRYHSMCDSLSPDPTLYGTHTIRHIS
jgi:hypothetical protein